jgi:hypothetical protein
MQPTQGRVSQEKTSKTRPSADAAETDLEVKRKKAAPD